MQHMKCVMEGPAFGKPQSIRSFRDFCISVQQEARRKIPASLLNQMPVRGRFLAQFSLQCAPTQAQVPGSVFQTKFSAAQPLTDEAKYALSETCLTRIRCQKPFGGFRYQFMRYEIGPAEWGIDYAAIHEQRIRRHAKSNRGAKNASALGNIRGLCVCEPDFQGFPVGAAREAVESYYRRHGHFAIMVRLRQRTIRVFPLKMRDRSVLIQLEGTDASRGITAV
jgi:hypothetical protein